MPLLTPHEGKMTASFYLWHTQRQGWITANGTTSTDRTMAKMHTAAEALARCKGALDHQQVPQIVPVRVNDLEALFA